MYRGADFTTQSLIVLGIQERLRHSFRQEAVKGCDPTIHPEPVSIEPPFSPYELRRFLKTDDIVMDNAIPRRVKDYEKVFLTVWFSSIDDLYWQDCEILLRELSTVNNVQFLIIGNSSRISVQLGVSKGEETPIVHAVKSCLPNAQIDISEKNSFYKFFSKGKDVSEDYEVGVRDFYAQPPYWKKLSGYEKTKSSLLLPVYSALSKLSDKQAGCFEVIFKKTRHDWRGNIVNLTEGERESGRHGSVRQGIDSSVGFGNDYQKEAREKISSLIFSVSIRLIATAKRQNLKGVMSALSLPVAGLQYGNKELLYLTEADYLKVLNSNDLIEMFGLARVYRSGMFLSSAELVSLLHFPNKELLEIKVYRIDQTIGFVASDKFLESDGVLLGYNESKGKRTLIRQPERLRNRHTCISGLIGSGKSVEMEQMALDDISRGFGVGFLDPHGDTVFRILKQIPRNRIRDTIFFNPCSERYIPCYNPFSLGENESGEISRKVSDFLVNIRSLYSSRDWGPVLESILLPVFHTLFSVENMSLADVRILLAKNSEGYALRKKVVPLIKNTEVRMFWVDMFDRIPVATIQRVLNKLTKFLYQEKVHRIFSQKNNKLNFREVIDNDKIFLGYFPAGELGSDCADILASTFFSDFYNAGMSRQNISISKRKPFTLYVDESARLKVKHLEDALRELRKYNLRLVLGYQQKAALSDSYRIALGNSGTNIVLDTNYDDAHAFFKEFFGEVEVNRFMRKGVGKAFVMMDGEIANLTTIKPKELTCDGYAEEIEKYFEQNYCVPVEQVKEKVPVKHAVKHGADDLYDEI